MLQAIKREFNFCFTCMKGKQIVILLACAVFMVVTNNSLNIANTLLLLFGLTTIAFTEVESRNKTYLTILSTSCTRRNYVAGKFIGLSVWCILVSAIGYVIGYILNLILPTTFSPVSFYTTRTILCYCLMIIGLYLIMYFCLGVKYARLAYFIAFIGYFMGFFAINNILEYKVNDNIISKFIHNIAGPSLQANILSIVIVLLVLALFYTISLIVYEKKDF